MVTRPVPRSVSVASELCRKPLQGSPHLTTQHLWQAIQGFPDFFCRGMRHRSPCRPLGRDEATENQRLDNSKG